MSTRSTPRPSGARRPRSAALLLTLLAAVALSLVPGSASAAGTVVPLADCYTQNSDGTFTVVLGYDNTTSSTITIPAGPDNTFSPSTYNSVLPTTFEPNQHHGVTQVTITQAELYNNPSWYLDGTRLDTSANVPQCTSSQLPMLANGAVVVGLALLAGLVGVVVVRRQRTTPAPGAPGQV